jgi:drug/metabolite transporter (DMT)-like permease
MANDGRDARRVAGLPLAIVSAASFGLSGPIASGLLAGGWSAGAIVLVRLAVGALAVAPFALADLRGRWSAMRRRPGLVVVYGLVPVALAQFAYFSAVARMDVGPALLIEYTAPAAVVVWLWLRRGERPTALTLAGAVVVAAGLVLVLGIVSGVTLAPAGVAWALVAMCGAATYFLLGAEVSAELPAVGLAGCGLVVGAVGLAACGAVGLLPMTASSAPARYAGVTVAWWVPLLALGVVTSGLAYCAGIAAMRRLGSRLASFVGLLEVLSGVVFAWLLLGQVPGLLQLGGGALVVAGIVVVRLGERPANETDLPKQRFDRRPCSGTHGDTPEFPRRDTRIYPRWERIRTSGLARWLRAPSR